MTPGRLLFLIFIVVPFIEIYLLIEVGSVIGALPTILLTVLTAITGATMVRHQGLGALAKAQQSMAQGQAPGMLVFDGACLLVAGALLLTPGFFTDTIGFLLLIPRLRRFLFRVALGHLPQRPIDPNNPSQGSGPSVIEGEFIRKD